MTTARGRTFQRLRGNSWLAPMDHRAEWRAHYAWEEQGRVCFICDAKVNSDHYCFGCRRVVCEAHPKMPRGRHKVDAHR